MMPKKILFILLFLAFLQGFAQISIKIEPSHTNYMLYDAVHIRMLLHNYSSMPITFGSNDAIRGSLDFVIDRPDRTVAKKIEGSRKSILEGVILAPGATTTITFDLAKFYSFQQTGRYYITAVITHPRLDKPYQSNQISLTVNPGKVLWQRKFGLPDYTGTNAGKSIQTRTYSVLRFNDGRNLLYYLLIDDPKKVYAIKRIAFDLGTELAPQLAVDASGYFHAMLAVTPKVFVYYVYDYNGKLDKRQVYIKTSSTPFLVVNPVNSTVVIDGGRIARKDVDYEEIKDLPFMDEIKEDTPENFRLPRTPGKTDGDDDDGDNDGDNADSGRGNLTR